MDNNKTFEEACYDFQKKMVKTFNDEQNIPFLLKYYLLKEVWEDIQTYKLKISQDLQAKAVSEENKDESQEENKDV